MCLHNGKGELVKAKTLWRDAYLLPKEAETFGVLEIIFWLHELRFQRVTIETYCKSILDGINKRLQNVTEFGLLLTRNILLSFHQNYMISFIMRQANLIVHMLVRVSKSYASSQTFYLGPTCMTHIIHAKMK